MENKIKKRKLGVLVIVIIVVVILGRYYLSLKFKDNNEFKQSLVDCSYNSELVPGSEFVNGQYTYRYKEEGFFSSGNVIWSSISEDGWGVILTDKKSTAPVTTKLCSTINNKPIVSMNSMFAESQANSIDLSDFDTSNVTDMSGMFKGSKVTEIDLSGFDTSKVTGMSWMFYNSALTKIDLSSFDTSKVTNMSGMFNATKLRELDLSNFDTSNVTNMNSMFSDSALTKIDLSSFDTSKVTNMKSMFYGSKVTELDLSSFNTENVADISFMFYDVNDITCYIRTSNDLNKFKSSLDSYQKINFIIK